MLLRGSFRGQLRDMDGNVIVSFNVGKSPLDLANIEGKQLDIKVTQHREKRTLTQNSYYWVLLSKLSAKLKISTSRTHNLLLRDVAYPFVVDGRIVMQPIPDTQTAEEEILEAETYHLKPTSGIITGNDGNIYRWYVVLRGSSTFDTQEMTTLLDRLISECKEVGGIEVLPPEELERMRKQAEEMERRKK